MNHAPHHQLTGLLNDLYAMELQAVAQLESAPGLAGDPAIAADFRAHLTETLQQADRVHGRMEELGESPSRIKDAIMKAGGKGFVLFARMQLETPGRLVAHAYAYEAMEWAAYGVLAALAEADGDANTAGLARNIQHEERAMMDRLERCFDAAEAVSHRDTPIEKIPAHVRKHLAEVHAFESQSLKLLEKATDISGGAGLDQLYGEHHRETREQLRRVEQRLRELDASPSGTQDAAMKLGALNWTLFFKLQEDTPAKLLAFVYAVEHLEIAAYELLRHTAQRAGDEATVALCDAILPEERRMTERLADHVAAAVEATLQAAS